MVAAVQAATRVLFSSQKVLQFISKKERRALMRQGGLVRSVARRSIRYKPRVARGGRRKGQRNVSTPGGPIITHQRGKGLATPKYVLYAFDTMTRNVVVGIAKLSGGGDPVPGAWEHGRTLIRRGQRIRIRKRPTMLLATATAVASPRFLGAWK